MTFMGNFFHFQYHSSIYTLAFQVAPFLQLVKLKLCMHLSSPSYVDMPAQLILLDLIILIT